MSLQQKPHHKTVSHASTIFASGKQVDYTERFSSLRRRTVTVAAAAYACGEIHAKRAARYHECCNAVTFNEFADNETGEVRRTFGGGKPCRQRLCPTCQHLKSRVLVSQVQQVHERHLEKSPDSIGLLLTLTVRNCKPDDLRETVRRMHHAFGKLRRRVEFEQAVRGFFRATEVTVSKGENRTYHPHMHVLLMVPKAYLFRRSGLYITQENWCRIWQECLGVDYAPVVDVKAITTEAMGKRTGRRGAALSVIGAIKEVAKYCVKPDGFQTEYEGGKFWTDPDVFAELYDGMRNHRLYAWGGDFDVIRKELALEDVEAEDFDLEEAIVQEETPAQNHTLIAKIHCIWNQAHLDGLGKYEIFSRLDMATGEVTVFDERFRGGG